MEVTTVNFKSTMTPEAYANRVRIVQGFLHPVDVVKDGEKRLVVNATTGKTISEVSDRYSLVTNAEVMTPFIEKFGYESVTELRSFARGKNLIAKIKTGRRFDFGGGDVLDEQIVLQNSYDKSKSFSFRMGAFRWVCSNGMYLGRSVVEYKKIHIGEIPVREILMQAMGAATQNDFSRWQSFQNIPLTLKQKEDLVLGFNCFEVKSDEKPAYMEPPTSNRLVNKYIKNQASYLIRIAPTTGREELDNQPNGWGLYNQFNRAIARVLPKNQIQKAILGNNNAEEYLAKAFGVN